MSEQTVEMAKEGKEAKTKEVKDLWKELSKNFQWAVRKDKKQYYN